MTVLAHVLAWALVMLALALLVAVVFTVVYATVLGIVRLRTERDVAQFRKSIDDEEF